MIEAARTDEEKMQRRRPAAPARTCIVTRAELHPEAGVRFALSPDGVVTPDLRRKLPGRGVWVTATAGHVAQAVKKGAFSRAFRAKAAAPADLAAEIDGLMTRDCLQSLSMANKAGLVVAGFAKAEAAIAAGQAAAVLAASDGGADGRRKLAQAFRRHSGGGDPVSVDCFSSAELDLALGRTNVIHAALNSGPATEAFLARWTRLKRYRGETAAGGDVTVADEIGGASSDQAESLEREEDALNGDRSDRTSLQGPSPGRGNV